MWNKECYSNPRKTHIPQKETLATSIKWLKNWISDGNDSYAAFSTGRTYTVSTEHKKGQPPAWSCMSLALTKSVSLAGRQMSYCYWLHSGPSLSNKLRMKAGAPRTQVAVHKVELRDEITGGLLDFMTSWNLIVRFLEFLSYLHGRSSMKTPPRALVRNISATICSEPSNVYIICLNLQGRQNQFTH